MKIALCNEVLAPMPFAAQCLHGGNFFAVALHGGRTTEQDEGLLTSSALSDDGGSSNHVDAVCGFCNFAKVARTACRKEWNLCEVLERSFL